MARKKGKLARVMEEFEKKFIISTMQKLDWSRKRTAEELGIPLSTLKFKMRKLGIYEIVPGRKRKEES